jgi:hypothetical protein
LLQSEIVAVEVQMSDDKQANVPTPEPVAETPPAPAPDPGLTAFASAPEADARDKLRDTSHPTLASIGASQTAVADELAAMTLELGSIARTSLTTTGDGVTALLRANSMIDMVEIQLDLARRNLDAVAEGSARLGEIGLRLFTGAVRPLAARAPS